MATPHRRGIGQGVRWTHTHKVCITKFVEDADDDVNERRTTKAKKRKGEKNTTRIQRIELQQTRASD